MGFWERTFKQKVGRRSLLVSWQLALLAFGFLLFLCMDGSSRLRDCLGVSTHRVGNQLLEAGFQAQMCAALGTSLCDPMQHSTWALDCFHSLTLRTAHRGVSREVPQQWSFPCTTSGVVCQPTPDPERKRESCWEAIATMAPEGESLEL